MSLRDNVIHTLRSVCAAGPEQKILVAVSGGLDSMVLLHLLHACGQALGVAHINYQLRGADSDADARLVTETARNLGLPCFDTTFNTAALLAGTGLSLQMLARKLRYTWLEEIRQTQGFDYIATAHHMNDSAETMLLNLSRGCGIRGLQGIPAKAETIIRPLIGTTRTEIEAFARSEGIPWREDASNQKSLYQRNKIRHHVIPVLSELNPRFAETMAENAARFREYTSLLRVALETIKEKTLSTNEFGHVSINLHLLQAYPAPKTVLYELLNPYGFNYAQCCSVLQHDQDSGQMYCAAYYQLYVNRGIAQISPRVKPQHEDILLHKDQAAVWLDEKLFLQVSLGNVPVHIPADPRVALLDFDKLSWPLRVRHWQPGDYFYPLGMHGKRKKLQDFFTNIKLSILQKQDTWILETARGEICWILGHRIDDRFKITENSERFIQLTCY